MERRQNSLKRQASMLFLTILILIFVAAAGCITFLFFYGGPPQISLKEVPEFIGNGYELGLNVTAPKTGLRQVKVSMLQKAKKVEVFTETFPRTGYIGKVGPAEDSRIVPIEPKKIGIADGPAEILIEAYDYSLKSVVFGSAAVVQKNITISTVPPKIDLLYNERTIKPGSSGIAIYRLSDNVAVNGVIVNSRFFPGFPVGGDKKNVYVSYFALPYDAVAINGAQVVAKDKAGNKAVSSFNLTLLKVVQKSDQINIDDGFLNAKIPEFQQHYPEMTGDEKEKYVYVNNKVRDQNDKKILELCQNPTPERLWQGRFLRMPGSPRAGYADHRTYVYKGVAIDRQTHLGIDIAQTERAEVRAANKGKVVFADYLGIYGNVIIIDHGQGVYSLYAHLSEFGCTVGQMVESNEVIARTGHTGMAGGDHLHFGMIIHGIFVTPIEWWDPHWIAVTIDNPLKDVQIK
jgi:murein DD-endopeptidase MepM/ murein hydrolase activator NlpD